MGNGAVFIMREVLLVLPLVFSLSCSKKPDWVPRSANCTELVGNATIGEGERYTIGVENSSSTPFTVTKVIVPCMCLLAADITGVKTDVGGFLKIECNVGNDLGTKKSQIVNIEIQTDSKFKLFRVIKLELRIDPSIPQRSCEHIPMNSLLTTRRSTHLRRLLLRDQRKNPLNHLRRFSRPLTESRLHWSRNAQMNSGIRLRSTKMRSRLEIPRTLFRFNSTMT